MPCVELRAPVDIDIAGLRLGFAIGIGIFCAMVVLVVIGPFIAPYPPEQVGAGLPSSGPSSQHWLGTDNLGRDVLSRLLAGGWSIILVPVVVVAITMVIAAGLWTISRRTAVTAKDLDRTNITPELEAERATGGAVASPAAA